MMTRFLDLEDDHNPLNGTVIQNRSQLKVLFTSFRDRAPFLGELTGDNGFRIILGLGKTDQACVQFSTTDNLPPYLVAISPSATSSEVDMEFLMGGTPTPISRRNCLPLGLVEEIAATFVETGKRMLDVDWEEV
jgi:hypothetical protein